eukprot:1153952-Pelagomonas_calceolata.AAC.5
MALMVKLKPWPQGFISELLRSCELRASKLELGCVCSMSIVASGFHSRPGSALYSVLAILRKALKLYWILRHRGGETQTFPAGYPGSQQRATPDVASLEESSLHLNGNGLEADHFMSL